MSDGDWTGEESVRHEVIEVKSVKESSGKKALEGVEEDADQHEGDPEGVEESNHSGRSWSSPTGSSGNKSEVDETRRSSMMKRE